MIIQAAIAAIEQYGPDALTAQIAEKAGVPRTHVYRHFDGKHSLDLAVARYVAKEIGESIRAGLATTATPRSIIGGAIDHHLRWVESHPNLYRFLAQHSYAVANTGLPAADDAKAALAAELTTLLRRYLLLFDVDPAPAERVIIGVVGMVDSTAAWWLEQPGLAREELTAQLTEQTWLIVDHAASALGLTLGLDDALPPLT